MYVWARFFSKKPTSVTNDLLCPIQTMRHIKEIGAKTKTRSEMDLFIFFFFVNVGKSAHGSIRITNFDSTHSPLEFLMGEQTFKYRKCVEYSTWTFFRYFPRREKLPRASRFNVVFPFKIFEFSPCGSGVSYVSVCIICMYICTFLLSIKFAHNYKIRILFT